MFTARLHEGLGIPLVLVVCAAAVAWSGDSERWSAIVLHAEPIAWVLGVWAVYGFWWAAQRRRALTVAVGVTLAGAVLHVPPTWVSRSPRPEAPAWLAGVQRCAAALGTPEDTARILSWNVADVDDTARVGQVVAAASPDLTVLYGVADEVLADALRAELGGESIVLGAPHPAVVHTRGVFHLCGDDAQWSDASGATLLFAGTTPDTAFPLLLGHLPAPTDPGGWAASASAARGALAMLVDRLASRSTVVLADAHSTATFYRVDADLLDAGAVGVAMPPSWPARLGALPFLPLHPWDRAWVGPGWRSAGAWRLRAAVGVRAPILVRLEPEPTSAR